jgi:hypothetical protein
MDDSDHDNDPPPTGWAKSKSEWEWEQARRKRLERVAQKIKKPGSAKRENARSSRGADTQAEHSPTAGIGSEATTPRSARKRSGYEEGVVDSEEFARSQSEWQALCKDKDTRIAKEAAATSQMRMQVATLREELEQVG